MYHNILLWQHIAHYVSVCVNQGQLKRVGIYVDQIYIVFNKKSWLEIYFEQRSAFSILS